MLLFNDIFLPLWRHESELFAAFIVNQRVYKQVEIVDLLDFPHEFADVRQELLWVNVINQVYVQLVLSEKSKRDTILLSLYQVKDLFKQNYAWLDSF